ncbi:ribonuclease J [Syntrophotalea acetylenica]|nr:ribonuclease J [Syntrophotalea acetylenica]
MTDMPNTGWGEIPADAVRILPLGGLGEIGLNMMAVEYLGELLLIDCGLMFPEPYMPGIDLVIPDVSCLEGQTGRIRGLILTHGHEDHIGAVPFLLAKLGFPTVYGSPLTLGLLRHRLEEHELLGQASLVEVQPRQALDLGVFHVEVFRVAHSIVDGLGVAIRTAMGWIVHTGDFKLDQTPVDDQPTDLVRLAAYGEQGVLLLMSDSTNVEKKGFTLSEREVAAAFAEIVPRAKGMVAVATFSSNIHRIQQVVQEAVRCGRKVAIAGRSMVANTRIARELGYLDIPDDVLIELRQARDLPRHRLLLLTTGSQGEAQSTLVRMAMEEFRALPLEPGDTVILSSKFIPGNEKAINRLINHLYRRGAEVFYETTSEVHVSGHASQEELKIVLSLVCPQNFVPVHGEYRHLVRHAELARGMGVPAERVTVLENGCPLVVSAAGLSREPRLETGRVLVDGRGVGDVGLMELRDRRHIANHGLVVVLLAVSPVDGRILYGPELLSRGFVAEEETDILDLARRQVCDMLAGMAPETATEQETLEVEVRKCLRRFFNRTVERRPLILPIILEQ